jgi:hypothetical protein
MRLGELFKGLERGKTGPKGNGELGSNGGTKYKVIEGNQYAGYTDATSKYKTIESLGFDDPKKNAYRFELLAYRCQPRHHPPGKKILSRGFSLKYLHD